MTINAMMNSFNKMFDAVVDIRYDVAVLSSKSSTNKERMHAATAAAFKALGALVFASSVITFVAAVTSGSALGFLVGGLVAATGILLAHDFIMMGQSFTSKPKGIIEAGKEVLKFAANHVQLLAREAEAVRGSDVDEKTVEMMIWGHRISDVLKDTVLLKPIHNAIHTHVLKQTTAK